jgi:ParB family chromosome partitioning protein
MTTLMTEPRANTQQLLAALHARLRLSLARWLAGKGWQPIADLMKKRIEATAADHRVDLDDRPASEKPKGRAKAALGRELLTAELVPLLEAQGCEVRIDEAGVQQIRLPQAEAGVGAAIGTANEVRQAASDGAAVPTPEAAAQRPEEADGALMVPLDDIEVGQRYRKDLGDLGPLTASITALGLLHPVGVCPQDGALPYRLIFGQRRLAACRAAGLTAVPARLVALDRLLEAQHDENVLRKDFTPSERVAIADAVAARLGDRQGRRTDLAPAGDAAPVADLPQVAPGEKTRDVAARRAGFSSTTAYRQAAKVVDEATPEVVAAMDDGTLSVSTAAAVADLPATEQPGVVAAVRGGQKPAEAVRRRSKAASATPGLDRLSAAWRKASPEERAAFVKAHVAELAPLLTNAR